MRKLLVHRLILCLCILFILTITSCRKEVIAPENIIQPVTLKEAKQWVNEHPLAQIVALDWEKAKQAGKKHEVIHVPVTPEDRLSQIRNGDTKAAINSLITGSTEPRGNASEPAPANPNYNQDHPPAVLFQKDSAGNVHAFMYNFIPADKDKENGKDGLWTGKLYQWNMKGDTVLVRQLNKNHIEELYFESSKRTTANSTAFSKLSATRPDNDMGSIWSWLRGVLSGIWEAIAVLAYQLGITSTVPPNSWTWNNNRWSDNEGGNEQTISYLGNDPVGYTFYLNYGGASYQAPTLSSVDLLMMRLGNQDDAVAQLVEGYEYQGMAAKLLAYLNTNFNSTASIDFVNWAIEYMLANPDINFELFETRFMGSQIETYSGEGQDISDDNGEYTGDKVSIPNDISLANGKKVKVFFLTTNSDGKSANNPIAPRALEALIFGLNEASKKVTISSISISATTNGQHAPTSNHSRGLAIDISRVDGIRMAEGLTDKIKELQIGFDKYEHIRENFGPHFKHKFTQPYTVGGHQDHIHISITQ